MPQSANTGGDPDLETALARPLHIGQYALVRRRRWVIVASLAFVAIGGCSAGADVSAPSVLVRYVDALNAADFDAAMAARCSLSQVAVADQELFIDQLDQLKRDAGGRLKLADVSEVADRRLRVTENTPVEHEFRFRIELPTGESTPIHVGTIRQGGADKLCAVAAEETFAVNDGLSVASLQVNPRELHDTRAASSSAVRSLGLTIVEDQKYLGRDKLGLDGWTTGWSTGHAGGRITAVRYRDRLQAVDEAWRTLSKYGGEASSTFSLSSMPEAIGVRYAGYAWTWMQPADLGPQVDAAVVVCDNVVVTMNVTGLEPTDDHSALVKVSEAVIKQMSA